MKPKTQCPVMIVGRHHRDLYLEHDALETLGASDDASALFESIRAMQDSIVHMPAHSAQGVLFQIGLVADRANHLRSCVGDDNPDRADAIGCERDIVRLAHSICRFLEEAFGVKREEVGGENFLPRRLDNPDAEAA